MDQDAALTNSLNKSIESQEKLIGMFSNMLKRQDSADKASSRARAKGSGGSKFWDQVKDDYKGASNAIQTFDGALNKAAGGVSSGLKMLSKDISGAAGAFQSLARGLLGATIGGELIGGITQYTTGLISSYKDLSEYGQTFSDGMFGLAKAAMASGVNMDEYSRMVKRNSVVMSQMNKKDGGFGALALQVRDNAAQFGMFGYTISGLNDLAGDYMDTLRMQGRLDRISKNDAANNITKLAESTTLLSDVFGKSRKEITETAQGVLRSASGAIAMGMMTPEEMKKFGPAIETAVTALASQAGEAGKMLPKFLMDTIAAGGNEVFTDTGKLMARMMPEASGMTAQLAADIKAAGNDQGKILRLTNDYNRRLKDIQQKNLGNFQIAHMAGGQLAAEADQLVTSINQIKVYKEEDLQAAEERAKASEKTMKLWGSLEQTWAKFSNSLLTKLFPMFERPMQAISDAFTKFEAGGGAEKIASALEGLGNAITNFVNGFTNDGNMERMKKKITEWIDRLASFIKSITPGASSENLTTPGQPEQSDARNAGQGFFDTLAKLSSIIDGLAAGVKFVRDHFWGLATTIGLVTGGLLALKAATVAANFVKSAMGVYKMSVKATNVTIEGGEGLFKKLFDRHGRGRDHGPHGPGGGGRGRGWMGRLMKWGGAAVGIAEGASEVMDVVKDHVEGAAEKAKPTEVGAEAKPGEVKPGEVKAEAKAGEVKAGEAAPATPKAEAAPSVKAEAAVPKVEPVAEGGFLKGMFKGGLTGFAMKGLGVASMLMDGYDGITKGIDAVQNYKKSGDTGQLVKDLIHDIVPKALGWGGAILGGGAGGLAGTFMTPGLGTAAIGLAGGTGGYMLGSAAGDKLSNAADKIVDFFVKPNSPVNRPAPSTTTPVPATLSDNQMRDIQSAQAMVSERIQNLERQSQQEDPNAKKQLEALQQLLEMMKDGTGINAAFLQKVADAVNGGNRRIVNAVTTTPR